jgi:hypothetical protein
MLSASLVLGLIACDDDGTGPDPATLAGTWDAIEVELVSVADPGTSVELIGLGGSATVVLNANGTFDYTVTFPGELPENIAGTWEVSADVFTMRWTEGGFLNEWQFDYSLVADELTLTGADSSFDFDDDGTEDPAKLNAILVRQ